MDRIAVIKEYADKVISKITHEEERKQAFIHTYGVAQCCALLASSRGLNNELAYISGLMHDLYAYFSGSYLCHSQSGADMSKVVLNQMDLFTKDEKTTILSAIFYHANKDIVHGEYDEILKDADLLEPFLNSGCSGVHYRHLPRLKKVLAELNMSIEPGEYGRMEKASDIAFDRIQMADVAEKLAAMKIVGERTSRDYMEIIKYYPEENAFDELRNAWCAAFVYHCSLIADIELPIRQPPIQNRFAGVGSWFEWGRINGFSFYEQDGFEPSRGDIVVYNNIIPTNNKPGDSAWHDHIGIVLDCDQNSLTVAEGNVDNENMSGVVQRKRDHTIGCYIRIPDGYEYDGWKYDYKAYLQSML